MQFKIGERAVYPAHGVGIIKEVETQTFEGEEYQFYVLKILDNGMTIRVPIQNADAIGMRNVISVEHVEKVYEVLRDRKTPTDNQTWNRRYREYMQRIKTGDPLEIGKVLRDLALMKQEKSLSFGERKMFDQAMTLLKQELSCARGVEESVIEDEIDAIFAKPEGEDDEGPVKKKKKKK